jgi:phosphoglycerate dehydrogenase-like enzyme
MNLATAPHSWRIGPIGYGEVGRILAETLRGKGVADVITYDIKLGTAAAGPLREHAERHSSSTRGT